MLRSLKREQSCVQAINQPAVICYTSGTTANPKGALLSQVLPGPHPILLPSIPPPPPPTQDNLTWTSASATEHYELVEGKETMISYLPVSHIVAQVDRRLHIQLSMEGRRPVCPHELRHLR